MLRAPAKKRDAPLWGPFGFPYVCGVTEPDFAAWASSPIQGTRYDQTLVRGTVGGILATFCGDCAQRNAALLAGTCIKPVLDALVDREPAPPL